MTWQIRAATPNDCDGLGLCMQAAYAVYQNRMGGARLPPMDVDYRAEIENYPCWVVDAGQAIVGGLVMSFADDRATLANIAIDPGWQGKGIGGALMRQAERAARERGHAELHLATHVLLEENLSLYRHLGWRETGREGERVFMQKTL